MYLKGYLQEKIPNTKNIATSNLDEPIWKKKTVPYKLILEMNLIKLKYLTIKLIDGNIVN